MDVVGDGQVAIAICTPLMKRVHRLVQQSADVVFVDVSPVVGKRRQCRVVVMATGSCAGGLPVGVLVATSDGAIKRCFELYASLLDERCFFGRGGTVGPHLFLIDDCNAVQEALCSVFCSASILLSPYHILVSFWRQLWDRRSMMAPEQRTRAFGLLRAAVVATKAERSAVKFDEARSDSSISGCLTALAYVTKIQCRQNEWALFCQPYDWAPTSVVNNLGGCRGLCDCASLSLKDSVIHRTKSMETVETLLFFAGTRIDAYYERRLAAVTSDQVDHATAMRFMSDSQSTDDKVFQISRFLFSVVCTSPSNREVQCNENGAVSALTCSDTETSRQPAAGCRKEFFVEMSIGLCSCDSGLSAAPCQHQSSVVQQFALRLWQLVPIVDDSARRLLVHIGTGRGVADRCWFASSHPLDSVAVVCSSSSSSDSDVDDNADNGECAVTEEQVDISQVQLIASTTTNDILINDPGLLGLTVPSSVHHKPVFVNWNGTSFEVNVNVASGDAAASVVADAILPTPDRLRVALKKIENAYMAHPDAMESAVGAFCQSVEVVDTVEMLNAALLCFSNGGSLTGTNNGTMAYTWS